MWEKLTLHGYQRLKERRRAKGKNAASEIRRVLQKGKNIDECPKYMQKYLANVLCASQGDILKVWGNSIYLFGQNTGSPLLITTFPIPQTIIHKAKKKQKYYICEEEM